jgi:hypothetical protein
MPATARGLVFQPPAEKYLRARAIFIAIGAQGMDNEMFEILDAGHEENAWDRC